MLMIGKKDTYASLLITIFIFRYFLSPMIRFKLGEMIEKKQFVEGRRVTINEIAMSTGLNRMTLSKILNQKGYGTGTDTVDRLCEYFNCEIQDLMEHLPGETVKVEANL